MFPQQFRPIDQLVIMVLVPLRPNDETSLAEIEIIALSTVVTLVSNWGDPADIALVIVEDVLLRIAGEAALSDDLVIGGGEGIGDYGGLEFLLSLPSFLVVFFFFDGKLDGGLHIDVHHGHLHPFHFLPLLPDQQMR